MLLLITNNISTHQLQSGLLCQDTMYIMISDVVKAYGQTATIWHT